LKRASLKRGARRDGKPLQIAIWYGVSTKWGMGVAASAYARLIEIIFDFFGHHYQQVVV
jgi:hypothetical protein